MRRIASAAIASLVALQCSAHASQVPASGDGYVAVWWTERDGLPSRSIWSLAQDRDGYIWLGTDEGLVRFDGVRFRHSDTLTDRPLPRQRVTAILSDADGSLWAGFAGAGVAHITNGVVRQYGESDGLVDGVVRTLRKDRDGIVWAAGPGGLYRRLQDRWEKLGREHGIPDGRASDVYEDRAGNLWVGTPVGVYRRNAAAHSFVQVDSVNSILNHFSEDSDGAVWTTDPQLGFRRVTPAAVPLRVSPTPMGNGVRLMHDRRGNLWVGTLGQGLWRVRRRADGKVRVVREQGNRTDLTGDAIRSLMEDREGDIWVGTQGGLHRISPTAATPLTRFGVVRAIEVVPDGTVWVGTASGLFRVTRAGVTRREVPMSVSALHHDANGVLWAGTDRGVYQFVAGRFTPLTFPGNTRLQRVVTIVSDSSGSLWLSDRDAGVFRWRHGVLSPVRPQAHAGRRGAYALHAQAAERVWLGLGGGRLLLAVSTHDTEFHDARFGGFPRAIYEGTGGDLWLASEEGLTRFRGGQFVAATRANGLPGNAVTAIVEDDEGFLWAGLNSGIVRLHPREFDNLASDPSHQLRYRLYDPSDGLAGAPLWLGNPGAARAADGRLWFVTGDGVTIVDPRSVSEDRPAPRARIEAIVADDERLGPTATRSLASGTRRLEFEYTALSFVSPTKIQFRYRLEGFDTQWIDAGTRRQAFYTNLPPRGYRFRVMARTSEGPWSDSGATSDFTIQPRFYQTSGFYAACALTLLLAVWSAWWLHLKKVQREFALVLTERTRMSREIHDTLLQSLVGIALQVQAVSGKAGSGAPGVKGDLMRIRMRVEDYIREARQAIMDLRSPLLVRRDLAAALKHILEHAREITHASCEFEVSGAPQSFPPKVEEQILRIGREAIQNAARHADAASIRVQLIYEDSWLRLHVADDGRGFDPAQHSAENLEGHCGLASMRERATHIGGRFALTSSPGRGTQVEAAFPLSNTVWRNV